MIQKIYFIVLFSLFSKKKKKKQEYSAPIAVDTGKRYCHLLVIVTKFKTFIANAPWIDVSGSTHSLACPISSVNQCGKPNIKQTNKNAKIKSNDVLSLTFPFFF